MDRGAAGTALGVRTVCVSGDAASVGSGFVDLGSVGSGAADLGSAASSSVDCGSMGSGSVSSVWEEKTGREGSSGAVGRGGGASVTMA